MISALGTDRSPRRVGSFTWMLVIFGSTAKLLVGLVKSRIRKRAHAPSGMRRTAEGAMLTLTRSHVRTGRSIQETTCVLVKVMGWLRILTVTRAILSRFSLKTTLPPIRSEDNASVIEER